MMDTMNQILRESAAGKPPLTLLLAAPRGFCAGVDRAIRIVELAIEKYGKPIYVRHEIVHNRFVVERLEKIGAIFIEELDEVPDGSKVIFSAHGVAKTVTAEAQRRQLFYLDATCPLVSKVHVEAERHSEAGRFIILVGHAGETSAAVHGPNQVVTKRSKTADAIRRGVSGVLGDDRVPDIDRPGIIEDTSTGAADADRNVLAHRAAVQRQRAAEVIDSRAGDAAVSRNRAIGDPGRAGIPDASAIIGAVSRNG